MNNYIKQNAKIAGAVTLGVGALVIQRRSYRKGYERGAVDGYTTAYSEVKELIQTIANQQK